ncbi:MAG TPA: ATP-grasp domain-containing protein [Streptosporangiaceae bacterium]|nr:ATP-grasp domain-containing protein [Streptosporangiaceae bacterium]
MSPRRDQASDTSVLVTGAGGPAAISVLKSLREDQSVGLVAADTDGWAAGLYLVPPAARAVIPAGAAPEFAELLLARCLQLGVDVVIPTVDSELMPLAAARAAFAQAGVQLMLAPERALALTLDKLALARACAGVVRLPRTEALSADVSPDSWTYPVIIKPRTGSGSRNITAVMSAEELKNLEPSADFIVQEYLPGEEYSIDVLADTDGRVVAGVPRVRARVDSGVSVAGRTLHDCELERFGAAVATAVGLTYIANIQVRRDLESRPALLEVNPRAPGSLALTIASGVDMPRLALDAMRGRPLPEHSEFCEKAMIRFLDERFLDLSEIIETVA